MCLNPRTVLNRGVRRLVPCGECKECLNTLGSSRNVLLQRELSFHKYAFFVTLTYTQQHVPRCRLEFVKDLTFKTATTLQEQQFVCKHREEPVYSLFRAYNLMPRLSRSSVSSIDDPDLISEFVLRKDKVEHYIEDLKQFNRDHNPDPDILFYLNMRDITLFKKRLNQLICQRYAKEILGISYPEYRKNVLKGIKYDTPKYRYFIVGEYGSKRKRPHFHCEIYTNSEYLQRILPNCINKVWKFGRKDIQRSDSGKSSSYVSSYINSSFSEPLLLKKVTGRRIVRSNDFGFPPHLEGVQEEDITRFIQKFFGTVQPVGSYEKVVRFTRSNLRSLFPYFSGFCSLRFYEFTEITGFYNRMYVNETQKSEKKVTCKYLAKLLFQKLLDRSTHNPILSAYFKDRCNESFVYRFVLSCHKIRKIADKFELCWERAKDFVYNCLKRIDYQKLVSFYTHMEEKFIKPWYWATAEGIKSFNTYVLRQFLEYEYTLCEDQEDAYIDSWFSNDPPSSEPLVCLSRFVAGMIDSPSELEMVSVFNEKPLGYDNRLCLANKIHAQKMFRKRHGLLDN